MSAGVGQHLLIEMYDCDRRALNDPKVIESALLGVARCCETTVIHHHFHQFEPQGVSGVIVIAESHISIHTWPELGYAAIDFFTCGNNKLAQPCMDQLIEALQSRRHSLRAVARGVDIVPGTQEQSAAKYQPLHSAIFDYNADFVSRFIVPEMAAPNAELVKRNVRELAEQVYVFPLFTGEFCRLLIEESENQGGWVTVLEKTEDEHSTLEGVPDLIEPDTTLSWERLPGMPEVYSKVIENHVRPVVQTLWQTFRLQKWDMPAVRKYEPHMVSGMDLHYDQEIVGMIGYLNTGFEGGGTFFPRWNLTIGRSGDIAPGSMAVYPGGVSHEHLAWPIKTGIRYMLSNSLY